MSDYSNWEQEAANKFHRLIQELEQGNWGGKNIVALWNLYLITSFSYYEKDRPLTSDYIFDNLCNTLYNRFDELEVVRHKDLVDAKSLKAGTGYHLFDKYPAAVTRIANFLERLV